MCIAFVADHVVAPVRFLRARIACGAALRMNEHVIFARLFLCCDLEIRAWKAAQVFAVPGGLTDEAEGESAVYADGETIFGLGKWWWR